MPSLEGPGGQEWSEEFESLPLEGQLSLPRNLHSLACSSPPFGGEGGLVEVKQLALGHTARTGCNRGLGPRTV